MAKLLAVAVVAAVAVVGADAGIGSFISNALFGQCNERELKPGVCAILFEDEECKGTAYEVKEGEEELPKANNNWAESVKVRKGCTFRGYEHASGLLEKLGLKSDSGPKGKGDVVVFVAPEDKDVFSDINNIPDADDDLEEEISYVSCTCGNKGKCAAVPKHLCGIAYDEENCDQGDWDKPYEIPVTDKINLERFSDARNGIQSLSVRKGCTLTACERADLSPTDTCATITAKNADEHVTLDNNPDKKLKNLKDNIVSLACKC